MSEFVRRLIASTIGPMVERQTRRVIRAIVFGCIAAGLLLGVGIFLCISGFFWLRRYYLPTEAALFMAGILFVLAFLGLLPLLLTRRPPRAPPKRTAIPEEIAPLVDTLKAAGCSREAAALLAGSQLAGQIKPYYLVAAAAIVGVILGRKFDPRTSARNSERP